MGGHSPDAIRTRSFAPPMSPFRAQRPCPGVLVFRARDRVAVLILVVEGVRQHFREVVAQIPLAEADPLMEPGAPSQ